MKTLCCKYEAAGDLFPVRWNDGNKVVQCHHCGTEWVPVKKAKKAKKESDHTPEEKAMFKFFLEKWCIEFEKATGQKYHPQGSDFRAIYTLLATDYSPDDLIAQARQAWASKYHAGQAGSIHKFSMNYNSLVMALRQPEKESREMQQAVVIPSKVIGGGNDQNHP